jgi:hypothetical protein
MPLTAGLPHHETTRMHSDVLHAPFIAIEAGSGLGQNEHSTFGAPSRPKRP